MLGAASPAYADARLYGHMTAPIEHLRSKNCSERGLGGLFKARASRSRTRIDKTMLSKDRAVAA